MMLLFGLVISIPQIASAALGVTAVLNLVMTVALAFALAAGGAWVFRKGSAMREKRRLDYWWCSTCQFRFQH
jgi:hypothetical protein